MKLAVCVMTIVRPIKIRCVAQTEQRTTMNVGISWATAGDWTIIRCTIQEAVRVCALLLYISFITLFVRSLVHLVRRSLQHSVLISFLPSLFHSLTHSLIYSFLLSSTTAKRQYLRGITQSFFDAHYQVFHSCAAVLNSFTFQNGLSQAVRQSFSRHTDFTQTKTSTFNLLWTTST